MQYTPVLVMSDGSKRIPVVRYPDVTVDGRLFNKQGAIVIGASDNVASLNKVLLVEDYDNELMGIFDCCNGHNDWGVMYTSVGIDCSDEDSYIDTWNLSGLTFGDDYTAEVANATIVANLP